jgi:predicted protein tyrosine phosphatase
LKQNLLFICSRNQWRSPTAEKLFRNHDSYNARSAGTSDKARIRLTQKLIDWADAVIVMERKHKQIIGKKFTLHEKNIIVLDIADDYLEDDPELIDLLKDKLLQLDIEL